MTNRPEGTDPTIEEDLAELEAYFRKGPSVSRAACGRMVTTYRLLEARARTVGASNGELRRQLDTVREQIMTTDDENDHLRERSMAVEQLTWEVGYLCDRILELREFDADDDHRITEAANDRLRAEIIEYDQLVGRLSLLLNGACVALKGPHPENGLHSLHDVPDLTRDLVRRWEREKERVLELQATVRQLGDDLELAGIGDVARRFGLTRPEARTWTRHDGFPAPIARLAGGPVWLAQAVDAYMIEVAGLHPVPVGTPDAEEESIEETGA